MAHRARAILPHGMWLVVLLAAQGCGRVAPGAEPTPAGSGTPLPAVSAGNEVLAEGRVVPVRHAALSFDAPGQVTKILVEEGDQVRAGQVLVRLDSAQQAAAVLQAEAELAAAQAALEKLTNGATAEEIAAAEAAVAVAQASVQAAAAAAAGATAHLKRVEAGATTEEVGIAERQVEQAKNGLWGAQSRRDSLCGRVQDGVADQADCDGAKAEVQRSEEAVRIAELQLQQLRNTVRPEDVTVARAGVHEAQAQQASAQAQLHQAQAELDRIAHGARAEDVAAARAAVDGAQAAVELARARMDTAMLRAPFDGTVASLDVNAGEQVLLGTPVLQLADLSSWRVETDDLTELGIVGVERGDPVQVTFDALPDLELGGTVSRVRALGENRQGDVVYLVLIDLDRQDERLRWNMTSTVRLPGE